MYRNIHYNFKLTGADNAIMFMYNRRTKRILNKVQYVLRTYRDLAYMVLIDFIIKVIFIKPEF